MAKEKIIEIEILRGISFLAIVLQHVMGGFLNKPDTGIGTAIAAYLALAVIRFGVPSFIFITGFVLLYNYGNTKLNYISFIKKRFFQIILPYIIWSSLYYFYNIITSGAISIKSLIDIKTLVSTIIHGNAMYHLWYMVMIIQFYLLFPIFKLLLEKCKNAKKSVVLFIAILLFQFVALGLYHNYLPQVCEASGSFIVKDLINYRDRIFIFWLPYFILGGIAALNWNEFKLLLSKFKILILIVWIVNLSYILYEGVKRSSYDVSGKFTINYLITSPSDIRMFIFLIFSILLVFLLSSSISLRFKTTAEFLTSAGKKSFEGYLIHPLNVSYSNQIIMNVIGSNLFFLPVLISYLLTVTSTLICAFLLSKLNLKALLKKLKNTSP